MTAAIARRITVGTLIGVVLAALGWLFLTVLRSDEITDKPTYAALQQIEFARRSDKLSAPVFVPADSSAGAVFGFPTDDAQFPNAWIAASEAKSDGSVYAVMTRTSHIRATCEQVESVLAEAAGTKVVEPVRTYLLKNCSS